jgi:predicted protein tyrosine phosphatase
LIILAEPRLRVAYAIDHGKVPEPPWALLSIHSHIDKPLLSDNVLHLLDARLGKPHVLSLCFDDVELDMPGYALFSKYQAGLILDFADAAKDVDTMIVQCDAGISRSAAVGSFLTEYYGSDAKMFRAVNPCTVPNQFVLGVLHEERSARE